MNIFTSAIKKTFPESFRFFFTFLKIRRRQFGFFCILSMLGLASEAIGFSLIFPILDYMNQNGDIASLVESSRFWQIGISILEKIELTISLEVLLSIFLIATVGRQIFDYIFTLKLGGFYLDIVNKIRTALFKKEQRISPRYYNQQQSGPYVNVLTFQVEEAANILPGYVRMFRYVLTFSVYALVLGFLNPSFALLGVFQIIIVAYPVRYFILANRVYSTKLVKIRDDIISFLSENFYAFKVIKIFSLEKEQARNLDELSKLFTKNTYALYINTFRIPLIFGILIGVIISLQLYVGFVWLNLNGSALATFIIIILRLAPTAQGFMKQKQALVKQQASLFSIQKRLDAIDQNNKAVDPVPIQIQRINRIDLKHITHSYDSKKLILNNFSATFRAGTLTLIAGRSGKGKTTILDIISGHLQPNKGAVLLNNTKLGVSNFSTLLENVSYASQEPFLFFGSLEKNIILNSEFDKEKFDESIERASAKEIIEDFSGRFYNSVQNTGNNLSGGQRQRIALARCFYRNKPILLLDEPTSDLDGNTEKEIILTLKRLTKEQKLITILISHNPDHRLIADSVIDL